MVTGSSPVWRTIHSISKYKGTLKLNYCGFAPFNFACIATCGCTTCIYLESHYMFRFLMCLFGFHGATEIEYTPDELHVCRDCHREIRKSNERTTN